MGLMYLENIKPGMVLAEDIRDYNGRFLLGKGLAIQEKHLRIFKIWGISQADIQGVDDQEGFASSATDPQALEQSRKMVLSRFPGFDPRDSLCKTLLNIFILFQCNALASEEKSSNKAYTSETADPDLPGSTGRLVNPVAKITDDVKLYSLPKIFFLIQEAIRDPRMSSKHIGGIISKDQALTAKLLKLVNSAFYGFPSKIDTISRAVTIIGTRQLSTLALGLSVISRFKNISSDILDMESFWKHSIACAIGAKTLAGYRNLPNTESFFVCGLLHDVGLLVMLTYFPDECRQVILTAHDQKIKLVEAEKRFFTHDHAFLGAVLAEKWKLPMTIEQSIRYHEKPSKAGFNLEATLVHIANIISIGCRIGSCGSEMIPEPDRESWQKTHLDLAVLKQTARLMASQMENIYRLLFADR